MSKIIRDLFDQKKLKQEEVKSLLVENKLDEAEKIADEIKEIDRKINLQSVLDEKEGAEIVDKFKEHDEPKNDYKKEFINGLRTKFQNAMKEGTPADGGYTVPQDILTQINELRESKDALQNLITVEPVTTLSGSRVFKARAQQTGFAEVAEDGTIAEKATPQFTQLTYSVKKYAGFFKATNDLLQDSDQAIESTLVRWIGDESRVTRNKLILAELGKKSKTALTGLDDIKKAMNVTLDPAFSATTIIVTNQDGFNWLDTQKDSDGNYILQADITRPGQKLLFGKQVVVISNKDLPTAATKIPFIIGDLKEAVVMFDRKTLNMMASNVAGDAYLTDVTLFRAIEREEVKTRDAEAFVYGEITTA